MTEAEGEVTFHVGDAAVPDPRWRDEYLSAVDGYQMTLTPRAGEDFVEYSDMAGRTTRVHLLGLDKLVLTAGPDRMLCERPAEHEMLRRHRDLADVIRGQVARAEQATEPSPDRFWSVLFLGMLFGVGLTIWFGWVFLIATKALAS